MLERNDFVLDGIAADFAGEAAVTARMRHSVRRNLRGAVAGSGYEWLLHNQGDVFRTHAEVDHLGAAMALDVEHRIEQVGLSLRGDGSQGLALPGGMRFVSGDVDVRAGIQTNEAILNRLADGATLIRIV